MAMEKLILRSVLWGADKIPDHWFEKVPGNFYGSEGDSRNSQRSGSRDTERNGSSNRRHSASYDGRDRGKDSRNGGNRSDGQQRGNGQRDRSADGRSSGQRNARGQSSYQDSGGDERRRRSYDDDGYGTGPRDPRDSNDPRAPYPRTAYHPTQHPQDRDGGSLYDSAVDRGVYGTTSRAAVASPVSQAGRSNSTAAQLYGRPPPPSSLLNQPNPTAQMPSSRSGSTAGGYVPYGHIYGGESDSQYETTPRPRYADLAAPPVMPPPDHYRQNPDAQLAPTAAAAGAGAAYTGQQTGGYYGASILDPWATQRNNGQDHPNGRRQSSQSPSGRRPSRRDDSGSDTDSRDSRDQSRNHQRSRSERRPTEPNNTDSRSKSRLAKSFDRSQRGLGYSAVGAVAGGLLGSEVGKGNRVLPVAIGATIGALGANAFQARERYVDPRRPLNAQLGAGTVLAPPPPLPFSRQGSFPVYLSMIPGRGYTEQQQYHPQRETEKVISRSPTASASCRRKEAAYNDPYYRDGAYERGTTKRRAQSGYYSD